MAGILHEDRIYQTLRDEFDRRREDLTPDSDEYWRLLASIAVEHVTADLLEPARSWPGWSDPSTGDAQLAEVRR